MAGISGFSNQKKLGTSQFVTVKNIGSDSFGISSPQMYLSVLSLSPITITAQSFSEDEQINYIEVPAHGARIGDVIRSVGANLNLWEFEVIELIDANTIGVYNIGRDDSGAAKFLGVGDQVSTLRWVTATSDTNGGLSVSPPGYVINDPNSEPPLYALGQPSKLSTDTVGVLFTYDAYNQSHFANIQSSLFAIQSLLAVKMSQTYIYKEFATTPVTNAAFVEISAAANCSEAEIFMSTGDALILAYGAAGAEVPFMVITPGGNGRVPMNLVGNRLSVKKLSVGTVNDGQLIINLYL